MARPHDADGGSLAPVLGCLAPGVGDVVLHGDLKGVETRWIKRSISGPRPMPMGTR